MQHRPFHYLLSILLHFVAFGGCWGNLGHRTIALLATKYLTDRGTTYLGKILNGTAVDDAAIWPDSYKTTPEGSYTMSWHFVDALDDPPATCSVNFNRDCKPSRVCAITAFKNMVSALVCPSPAPH
jgi:hypothetical protein